MTENEQLPRRSRIADWLRRGYQALRGRHGATAAFDGSRDYWERRYAAGGNSGAGSYDKLAEFKAEVLNEFVSDSGIRRVIEFGCGDGNQLALATYPEYLGFDVSETAIEQCRQRFADDKTRAFGLMQDYAGETADLALSLDVIYHLVEDSVYEDYMRVLFAAAERYVIVYSSDSDENSRLQSPHVRHRRFSAWVDRDCPGWRLLRRVPNRYPQKGLLGPGSFADFYIYERRPRGAA